MTAKSLQTPQIIEIKGSTIRVAHPSVSGNVTTALSAPIAAAGTAAYFRDNNGFADNDWFVVGQIGRSQTEENDVNGAVTRGSAITITNALSFAHELDAPVTKIYERGIKIYGAATDGGAGTLIASIEAITASGRQLADAVMIQWDRPYTEYTLISTDTAYAYYYAVFTDGAATSSASDYVASTGVASNSVEMMSNQALVMTNTEIDGELISRDMLVTWAQDAQDAIAQFVYQDSQSGEQIQKNWSFEVATDGTLSSTQGVSKVALSTLTYQPKYTHADSAIISIRIGAKKPLIKLQLEQLDRLLADRPFTRLNGAAVVGATTLTVDSTADFADSGSVQVLDDTLTYTGTTSTTFTGIPASGTGSITDTHADNSEVWQNNAQAEPRYYCIDDQYIVFDKPVDSENTGKLIKVRMFKKLDRLTKLSDTTDVPFYNVFQYYIASKIERRKDNREKANEYLQLFHNEVLKNALADKVPVLDKQIYYNFQDPLEASPVINDNEYYKW